jgi:hypothetical protein
MAIDTIIPQSRRAILAAGLGGLVAAAASALGRPLAVRAVNGDPVLAGSVEDATSTTGVTTTAGNGLQGITSSRDASGVYGENTATDGFGIRVGVGGRSPGFAVYGEASGTGTAVKAIANDGPGVDATSNDANAVSGVSDTGFGVYAQSNSNTAMHAGTFSGMAVNGDSAATDKPAIRARAYANSTGVLGYSGALGSEPAAPAKTGVHGYAVQDAASRGVIGQSAAGQGVRGQATTGTGVYAIATTGTALRAEGAVRFKTSGLATIAMGSRSVLVTPAGLDVTTSSKILALLQSDAGGSTTVQRVAINATANTFTIYLTANSVRAVKVSWFVIS